MDIKNQLDEVVGEFFFANGIPLHVTRSLYYRKMMSIVAKYRGPSFVPPCEHKFKTTVLDRQYNNVGVLMEMMKACWIESGCNIIMDGWTDIRHRPLINIMVTCVESPYFLKAIDCSQHHKGADFQFHILREAIEEVGP